MALGCYKLLSDWIVIAFSSLNPYEEKKKGKKYSLCMQNTNYSNFYIRLLLRCMACRC